eukprot:5101363-Amphidinium_carterae.5
MDYLRQKRFSEDQVQHREWILQQEKILELYIVLSESTLEQWLQLGRIPSVYMENRTDDQHTWYNFHARLEICLEYTINDFLNIYLYIALQNSHKQLHIYVNHNT